MTIDAALPHARQAATGASAPAEQGTRSAACSPATHRDAWNDPPHAARPRDSSSGELPRRPALLRGGVPGLHHRALQNPLVPRASLLPPGADSKDSQLAETLRDSFGLLHPFLRDGRLTLSSLRQVAEATMGESDKLDHAILAAREIIQRPPLRDAILSSDGDITRDSLLTAVTALQGNSSPNAFSQDPFHGRDNAQVVEGLQGMFERLRDPIKDRTFFFDKYQYVEIDRLRALMRDPDAVGPHGLPVLEPTTGLPGKQYSELSVYTAKNILERPGLLRSLERASAAHMFGLVHQKDYLCNKGLDRWLEQDKAHKAK